LGAVGVTSACLPSSAWFISLSLGKGERFYITNRVAQEPKTWPMRATMPAHTRDRYACHRDFERVSPPSLSSWPLSSVAVEILFRVRSPPRFRHPWLSSASPFVLRFEVTVGARRAGSERTSLCSNALCTLILSGSSNIYFP
jgi:hypothetical protein